MSSSSGSSNESETTNANHLEKLSSSESGSTDGEWEDGGLKGRQGGSEDSSSTSSGETESETEESDDTEEAVVAVDKKQKSSKNVSMKELPGAKGKRTEEGDLAKTTTAKLPIKKPVPNRKHVSTTNDPNPKDSRQSVRPPGSDSDGHSDSDEDGEGKGKTKRRGRPSPFTDEQRTYIEDTYGKEWLELVKKYPKKKHLKKLAAYKSTTASAILKSELFKGKLGKHKTKDQWRTVSDFPYL